MPLTQFEEVFKRHELLQGENIIDIDIETPDDTIIGEIKFNADINSNLIRTHTHIVDESYGVDIYNIRQDLNSFNKDSELLNPYFLDDQAIINYLTR